MSYLYNIMHFYRMISTFFLVKLVQILIYCVLVQTMLAAIKMEVMTPTTESPDEGCIGYHTELHLSFIVVILTHMACNSVKFCLQPSISTCLQFVLQLLDLGGLLRLHQLCLSSYLTPS